MKKCLSLILAFVMMLTMLPMGVLAAEENTSEKETLAEKACEVFPEYTTLIRGEVSTYATPYNAEEPAQVIKQEIRPVSDTENIILSIFSDGNAVVVDEYVASVTKIASNEYPFSGGARVVQSYKIFHTNPAFLGVLNINNTEFYIYTDAPDRITSLGSPEPDSWTEAGGLKYVQYTESSSAPAGYERMIYFKYGGQKFGYTFGVQAGNNNISVYTYA